MIDNYFNLDSKRIFSLLLFFFCIGIFQNVKALTPSFEIKSMREQNIQNTSSKKAVLAFKNAKLKPKKEKISFSEKLSILKLVLKNKPSKKRSIITKQAYKQTEWNGSHTAGLLSWASLLVAVMAFFTSHFLLGIFASCSAILFLLLIFVKKGSKGTVDDVLWLFSQIINVIVIIATIFD